MTKNNAVSLIEKITLLQSLMIAFATDGRSEEQPMQYKELYIDVALMLEEGQCPNPNPHSTLEIFFGFYKLKQMKTYAERRLYIDTMYADIFLDLNRAKRQVNDSKLWKKANGELKDILSPVRTQWLKAKNFIVGTTPDYENSIKESINSVESCLKILLNKENGTLGKLIKDAKLDADVERLIVTAYGAASNRDFVRHGGVKDSLLEKEEAEFFLDFSASSIVYISKKLKINNTKICIEKSIEQ